MRRADREIADFDEMCRVLTACDVCRIALTDDERPYILPLNFGMKTDGRALILPCCSWYCTRPAKLSSSMLRSPLSACSSR